MELARGWSRGLREEGVAATLPWPSNYLSWTPCEQAYLGLFSVGRVRGRVHDRRRGLRLAWTMVAFALPQRILPLRAMELLPKDALNLNVPRSQFTAVAI